MKYSRKPLSVIMKILIFIHLCNASRSKYGWNITESDASSKTNYYYCATNHEIVNFLLYCKLLMKMHSVVRITPIMPRFSNYVVLIR